MKIVILFAMISILASCRSIIPMPPSGDQVDEVILLVKQLENRSSKVLEENPKADIKGYRARKIEIVVEYISSNREQQIVCDHLQSILITDNPSALVRLRFFSDDSLSNDKLIAEYVYSKEGKRR